MNKAIVTTTINPPTEALKKFAEIGVKDGWQLIIVGDRKTPHQDYLDFEKQYANVKYLDLDEQENISKKLSDLIGWNCIQRRNFGFIYALRTGAEIIATIDDDNIPLEGWGQNCIVGQQIEVRSVTNNIKPVLDPLDYATTEIMGWHRGYPLELVSRVHASTTAEPKVVDVLVQADLWLGEPDVDAIYRISQGGIAENSGRDGDLIDFVRFNAATIAPFNSQNTFLHRDCFPSYFLFPHIGRMDDIWAAYHLQHEMGNRVVFSTASVRQVRNPHSLVKDLEAEMIGYKHNLEVATIRDTWMKYVPEETVKAYEEWKTLVGDCLVT